LQRKKLVVLIDGGYLRARARHHNLRYDPDFIEKVARSVALEDEDLLRVLYYDCAPFAGKVKLPVSGQVKEYTPSDEWLRELAEKDLFAVRRGELKFRGFKPKRVPVAADTLSDDDFTPVFEQKGVDMRIGLDISLYSQSRSMDRIALLSGDTDCIAAMKHARKEGIQVILVQLPGEKLSSELLAHADFRREVSWPAVAGATRQAVVAP
jgi:Uncharacterized conserved protein